MYLFDEEQKLRKYHSIYDIINKYFPVRYKTYELRKAHMIRVLDQEVKIFSIKAKYIQEQIGVDFNLVNCRFIKPLDADILNDISKKEITHIVTIEEGSIIGGLGSMINDHFNNTVINIKTMGIPDKYIEHGTRGELLKEVGLDRQGLVDTIKAMYNEK